MVSGKYDIGSKYYENNVIKSFQELWNEDFSDVTLATSDDKQVKAHKIILSASSTFFKNILLKNPHPNPLLYLKDIKYEDLCMILQFIYLGQYDVGPWEMTQFLSTGKALGVAGLTDEMAINKEPKSDVGKCVNENKRVSEEDVVTNGFDKEQESCMPVYNEYNNENIVSPQGQIEREDAIYCCNQCDFKTANQMYLNGHQQSLHEGVILNDCNQCDYKTKTKGSLIQHKKGVHEGVRYSCDQCDYKGTSQSNLTKHKLSIHDGLRYSCGQCEYKATQQCNLTTHKITIHEGVRYTCDQCE